MRQSYVATVGVTRIADVITYPAPAHPGLGPGVAGDLLVLRRMQIAADVARRHAQKTGAGQKHMRVVLAHAFAFGEGLRRRITDVGDACFIWHAFQQSQHHIVQSHVRARLDRGAKRFDKALHRRIHTGQRGGAQIHGVRHRALGLALVRRYQVHATASAQHNVLAGVFQHQAMAEVAVSVCPLSGFAGQVQLPVQHVLPLGFGRGHAQHLYAAAHRLFVAVTGFVKYL